MQSSIRPGVVTEGEQEDFVLDSEHQDPADSQDPSNRTQISFGAWKVMKHLTP